MKSPGMKSLASCPGPYRSAVAIVVTIPSSITPGGVPSPGTGDLVERPGPGGIDPASKGQAVGEQLSEHGERERGQLFRQPGVEADGVLVAVLAGAVEQPHHPAALLAQAPPDRLEAG